MCVVSSGGSHTGPEKCQNDILSAPAKKVWMPTRFAFFFPSMEFLDSLHTFFCLFCSHFVFSFVIGVAKLVSLPAAPTYDSCYGLLVCFSQTKRKCPADGLQSTGLQAHCRLTGRNWWLEKAANYFEHKNENTVYQGQEASLAY